jgi:hypothetical protein
MTFFECTKLLELPIPGFLPRLELETNCVEPRFPFRVQPAIFEESTLSANPTAQFRDFLVLRWHIACNSGRETAGVLVRKFKMKVNC